MASLVEGFEVQIAKEAARMRDEVRAAIGESDYTIDQGDERHEFTSIEQLSEFIRIGGWPRPFARS